MTPFQYASNNPIRFIDIDGLEGGTPAPPGEELDINREELDPEGIENSSSGLEEIKEDHPYTIEELKQNAEAFVKNNTSTEQPEEGPVENPMGFTIDPSKPVIANIPKGAGIRLLENKTSQNDNNTKGSKTIYTPVDENGKVLTTQKTKAGNTKIDPEASGTAHTQLRTDKTGKYPQRTTFDAKGRKRADTHFTTHKEPGKSNPHKHTYYKNGQRQGNE
jgi:PBP1b-binding outer membrane lipoprotein LpoB